MSSKSIFLVLATLITLSLTGCGAASTPTPAVGSGGVTAAAPGGGPAGAATPLPLTATTVPTPTATPEPLALRVNADGISVAEYQVELRQLQDAHKQLGKQASADEERQQVLDSLADGLLLAQGAAEAGFKLDEAAIQAEINRLGQQMGGPDSLKAWMETQGYTYDTFRSSLYRNLAAAWQRDQIAAQVPVEAEQIHARQILTTDASNADKALQRLQIAGTNFAAYAYQYDPLTGGDLGWFPRGYLAQPAVEEAAFQLEPGQYSAVIESAIGYHIIQVIAREPSRTLSPDARRVLQHKALQDWLKIRREKSQVEILLP